jgi:hypothetical protein
MLRELAPDDVPKPSLALKPAERARAIQLLKTVKHNETGWHRQLAIYLLASIGCGYERNREELLATWRKDGDDGTMRPRHPSREQIRRGCQPRSDSTARTKIIPC